MTFPFHLGELYITVLAGNAIRRAGQKPGLFLSRHVYCDWEPDIREENEIALKNGLEIRSEFVTGNGERVWVITNRMRTRTTILTPEEYYYRKGHGDD